MTKEEWINWGINDGMWELLPFENRAIWDGTIDTEVKKQYRISIVTTVMGRLHDLSKTLPQNIEDNSDYENLEFVIVDYNSPDKEGEWIKENYMDMIESGKLIYVRTDEPQYYSMSHSRNIGFKVATGEIIKAKSPAYDIVGKIKAYVQGIKQERKEYEKAAEKALKEKEKKQAKAEKKPKEKNEKAK